MTILFRRVVHGRPTLPSAPSHDGTLDSAPGLTGVLLDSDVIVEVLRGRRRVVEALGSLEERVFYLSLAGRPLVSADLFRE